MKKNSGFTLIEVLVATLIMAIGLLGLAGLQANGLKNSQSAYMRTQATQLAYDMADRMRANVVDASTFAASVYSVMPPANAVLQATCLTVAGCTPALMAQHDLFEWNRDLTGILPLGAGLIAVVPGNIYTITINWDDNRDGNVDNDPGNAIPDDPNFQMSFQL